MRSGAARSRISLHLRASAGICGHFRTSEPETLNLEPETLTVNIQSCFALLVVLTSSYLSTHVKE